MHRREGIEPQVIALSGVIGETNGFERWLGARLLRRDERPVPLNEGLILWDGRRQYLDAKTGKPAEDGPVLQPQYSGKNSSQDIIIPPLRNLDHRKAMRASIPIGLGWSYSVSNRTIQSRR